MSNPSPHRAYAAADDPGPQGLPANRAVARLGPDEDEAAAKPLPQATLHEMIDVCHDEALRIETTQEILVRGGSRRAPDPQMVRRMEIFQATVRFLEECYLRQRAVRRVLDGPADR